MRPQGLILLVIAIPNLILGGFILLRNFRDKANSLFAALSFVVGLWSLGLGGYALTDSLDVAKVWAQFYYAAAAAIAVVFLFFSLNYTKRIDKLSFTAIGALLLPAVLMISAIIFAPQFIIANMVHQTWGKEVILNSSGYLVYSIYFILYVGLGFGVITGSYKKAKGIAKTYLKFILGGFAIAFSLGAMFNLFLPAAGNYRYVWVGPLFTMAYVVLISYAIIRHRLFDVRLIVARSLGYAFSLFALAVIFGGVAFNVLNGVAFSGEVVTRTQQISYTALAVTIAFAFQPMKRFFDKLSNSIFYRDAYDPQELLDNLNKVLVTTTDLTELFQKSSQIIKNSLKTEFSILAINDSRGDILQMASININATKHDISDICKLVDKSPNKAIVADYVDEDDHLLAEIMKSKSIAAIIKLKGLSHQKKDVPGYLILGLKQNGGPYDKGDVKILEIISDELVVAIQNSLRFEQIEQFNLTLQKKVDDATKKLRNTNEKLKTLDQTKDEFISMASHQLRTPLTSVKGYLSMVIEGDVGDISKSQKKLLEQAFTSSQRMVYLIADLLNVSRLRTGKFVIDLAPTSLVDMVQGEVNQLKATAASRKLELAYDKPDNGVVSIMLDETKTRQVVMNFIDNAIYYTPEGGKIIVSVAETAKSVEFRVKDNGIGVPKSERHHLFTKFYRAGNARKARPDGTGLGLFMAKKVIIAQGGTIIFDTTEGKGSTFGFAFDKHKFAPPKHLK